MPKELTQEDCRKLFVEELERLMTSIDAIDRITPWSEREPEWWCRMMDIRSLAQSAHKRHKREP